MSPNNAVVQQQLIDYGISCVQSGLHYFYDNFGNDVHPISAMPTATGVDGDPFLSPEQLKEELPSYLARASAVASSGAENCDTLKNNSAELPV